MKDCIQAVVDSDGHQNPKTGDIWLPAQLDPSKAHLYKEYKKDHVAFCQSIDLDPNG